MAIVELKGVSHEYPGKRQAVSDVSLSVQPGERVGLIGPSGAGKSTLLRTINGLVTPQSGETQVLDQSVRELNENGRMRLRRQIGMIFQEFALIERLPVLTNVLVGRLGYTKTLPSLVRYFAPVDVQRAKKAIGDVGLSGSEGRLVRNLSGGQKQRVGIARALVQEAPLILADEPTANLDVRTSEEVLSLLVKLGDERGATMILSLHDVRLARRFCTRIVALKEGVVAWDGRAGDFTDSDLERVFYE